MNVVETHRLTLRHLVAEDAPFILRLVNEPSWLENIGDRGVTSLADAQAYLRDGPLASYRRWGFGLFLVTLEGDQTPIGVCGLLQRDTLEHPDVGFALLPQYWGQGYAFEAADATLAWAQATLGLERVLAITAPHNRRSAALLQRLGFRLEGRVRLEPGAEELDRYAR